MKKCKIKGVANFRELGGIITKDGKKIKHGYFFRSGQLGDIKENAKVEFDKLNIKNIVDYRAVEERAVCEDYVGNAKYYFLPAIKDSKGLAMEPSTMKQMVLVVNEKDAKTAAEGFSDLYSELPFDNDSYVTTMQLLNEFSPMLVHCTAGKDRTGIGCALILKSLGVSDDEIVKNFMLSNRYRWYENNKTLLMLLLFKRNKWARYLYKRISFVHEYNIKKTLDAIEKKYPDFNDYLSKECGISREQVAKWKEFYLE